MRRRRLRLGIAVAGLALLSWHLLAPSADADRAILPAAAPAAASGDRLIVEPDDGMTSIYALLGSARRTLDMTMYELADPTAETILAGAAARGVRVRVILDARLERTRNAPAFNFLRRRGVVVAWSSDRYFATHQKTFVVDDRTAVVMSLNLTSRYYATSRDAAVVDTDRRDVAAIEAVFAADLHGADSGTPAADDLVWSPGQSQADLVALLDRARRSIMLESEELSSGSIVRALTAAARRGVRVDIAMTYDEDWRPAFDALRRAGARISLMYGETPLYLHAKLLVVDAGTSGAVAFVGSENLSDASLLHDRELGVVLLAPPIVGRIARLISADVADGRLLR